MTSKKEEKELESELAYLLGKLRELDYHTPEKRDTEEWKSLVKSMKNTWYKLVSICPSYRFYEQEISETLYPEYFL